MKKEINKIILITSKDCDGCYEAKQNLERAIFQSSKEIIKEVKDKNDAKDLIKSNRISNFPAALYYVGTRVVNKAIGRYPAPVYLRWIDVYFKN